MMGRGDRWIRQITIGSVVLLALIAGTVSYLHMHRLVALHGQPGWVAALTPLAVDGVIVAASTSLLADSRHGARGGLLPWALLAMGTVASLAANVAVAEPNAIGRIIAAWPSFALIGSYELLMRQVRHAAPETRPHRLRREPEVGQSAGEGMAEPGQRPLRRRSGLRRQRADGSDLQRQIWRWALAHRGEDGSLPSGKSIADEHGRHERWGRLVKRGGLAGNFDDNHLQGPPSHEGDKPAARAA